MLNVKSYWMRTECPGHISSQNKKEEEVVQIKLFLGELLL